ncbi:MAG: Cytochrome P450-terp [Pseudomonadales bacterium]|nr:Cytochrome P450-terp [Pseudomonadales bacterium]
MPPQVLAEQQQSMTFMDPPAYGTYRSLVDYAFRLKQLEARKPLMRRIARETVDRVIERGECEFVTEIAMQMPMRMMFALLGVRDEDYGQVVNLVNTLALADDPEFAVRTHRPRLATCLRRDRPSPHTGYDRAPTGTKQ